MVPRYFVRITCTFSVERKAGFLHAYYWITFNSVSRLGRFNLIFPVKYKAMKVVIFAFSATPLFLFTSGDAIIKLLETSTKSPRGILRLTVEWFLRQENDRWLGWNTDYKYYSKDTRFRRKIKWRLELLGAQWIMGKTEAFVVKETFCGWNPVTVSMFSGNLWEYSEYSYSHNQVYM